MRAVAMCAQAQRELDDLRGAVQYGYTESADVYAGRLAETTAELRDKLAKPRKVVDPVARSRAYPVAPRGVGLAVVGLAVCLLAGCGSTFPREGRSVVGQDYSAWLPHPTLPNTLYGIFRNKECPSGEGADTIEGVTQVVTHTGCAGPARLLSADAVRGEQ